MNLPAARPRTAVTCALAIRLGLWLLPAVLVAPAASPGFAPPLPVSRPYLATLGPTPLRVAETVPPPDLSSRPGPAAPPRPNDAPASDPAHSADVLPSVSATPAPELFPDATPRPTAPEPTKSPPPILVDDARPRVKPEDFLPFFIFPGHGETNVVVPAAVPVPATPGTLAPSSATYRQQ